MELKDTVKLMLSDDWRDRLKAEWLQATIRCRKLTDFINAASHGEKVYKSESDKFALKKQQRAMVDYIIALEHQMKNAGIEFTPYGAPANTQPPSNGCSIAEIEGDRV